LARLNRPRGTEFERDVLDGAGFEEIKKRRSDALGIGVLRLVKGVAGDAATGSG